MKLSYDTLKNLCLVFGRFLNKMCVVVVMGFKEVCLGYFDLKRDGKGFKFVVPREVVEKHSLDKQGKVFLFCVCRDNCGLEEK